MWDHPHNRPDLSPCDFHIFGPVKEELSKRPYHSYVEVNAEIQEYLSNVGRDFLVEGFGKRVPRIEKNV